MHTGRHFLQIPGPTNVPDRVLRAMAQPVIDHRGPEFAALSKDVLHRVRGVFQTTGPVVGYDPNAQGAASSNLEPRSDWTDVALVPGQFKPPIEVEFCYLHSFGANRGVLEVDRIELVR